MSNTLSRPIQPYASGVLPFRRKRRGWGSYFTTIFTGRVQRMVLPCVRAQVAE
jgi:hypothetical protein